MTGLEYALTIKTISLIFNEAISVLIMLKSAISKAEELSDADKATLLTEIENAQKTARVQKYPDSET